MRVDFAFGRAPTWPFLTRDTKCLRTQIPSPYYFGLRQRCCRLANYQTCSQLVQRGQGISKQLKKGIAYKEESGRHHGEHERECLRRLGFDEAMGQKPFLKLFPRTSLAYYDPSLLEIPCQVPASGLFPPANACLLFPGVDSSTVFIVFVMEVWAGSYSTLRSVSHVVKACLLAVTCPRPQRQLRSGVAFTSVSKAVVVVVVISSRSSPTSLLRPLAFLASTDRRTRSC